MTDTDIQMLVGTILLFVSVSLLAVVAHVIHAYHHQRRKYRNQ